MASPLNIVWFKRDLRVHDHAPLALASREGAVLPLYIVEPELWSLPDSSRRHWSFIHDCLGELRADLAARGAPLILRIGEALEVLEMLRLAFGSITLWSHEETGNDWTFRRDKAVKAWCRAHTLSWHETPTNGVVRGLKDRDHWAAQRNQRMAMPIIPAPARVTTLPDIISQVRPPKSHAMFGEAVQFVQNGGRAEGLRCLDSFLTVRAAKYMQTISKPGVSARHCSRLSAHLAFGTLSSREVEHATRDRLRQLAAPGHGMPEADAQSYRKNLGAFLSRLAWRCHFVQKLEQQPDIEFRCTHPAFEGMREPHFNADFFEAWKTGRTGYPLIDAAMRSLHANGWINFRMRAMLVSFASYHLWLDWRQTAPHMAKLFTDYEPGIHLCQFQMQSGVTGINTLRIYSPVKQSLDHDPEGKFIKRYVSELADVASPWVHEPWRMPEPPADYPSPLVRHDHALQFARAQLAARRKQPEFRAQALKVVKKLASRARPQDRVPSRKKPAEPPPKSQLTFDF